MNNDTRYMLTVLEITREQVTALVDHLNRVQEYVAEQRAGSDIVQLLGDASTCLDGTWHMVHEAEAILEGRA